MAKKRFKLDDMLDLTSQIELEVKGKVFTVKSLKRSILDQINKIEKNSDLPLHDSLAQQLAVMCECEASEFIELDLDARELKAMVTFILGELQDAGEEQRKSVKVVK